MKGTLREALGKGEVVTMAWSGLGSAIVAESLARYGYAAVNVDMQHGLYGFAESRDAIAGIKLAGGYAIARIPVDDFATASRFLDCGADAIIAPMINSLADAKSFVEATKFPPLGARSYGPHRAVALWGGKDGQEYVNQANDATMTFAMIETQQALDSVEEIANVPGIDGLFVGPADLSISLSNGTGYNPTGENTMRAAAEIARHAKSAGKIASAFAVSPEHARQFADIGFTLISNGTDMSILKTGSNAMLQGE